MPPRLLLVLAAILFSTGGAAIKYNTLTAWQVAAFRSLVAAVALWAGIPAVRRRPSGKLLAVGCAYAAMLILFVSATKLTTAANAIFLQSTAPVYLLFLGPVLLKEPLRRSDWALIAFMIAGIGLIFSSTDAAVASAPNPKLGNWLGAGSGLAWALVISGLRYVGRDEEAGGGAGMATVFAGNAIAFLACVGPAMPVNDFNPLNALAVLYLGTCQVGLAYWCLTRGMQRVRAFEAAAILLVEPALNPLWAWLSLGERPSEQACIGGGILLLATALNAWWNRRCGGAA